MANAPRRSPEEITAEKEQKRTTQIMRVLTEIRDKEIVLAQLKRQLDDLLKAVP